MADLYSSLSRVHLNRVNEICDRIDALKEVLLLADSPARRAECALVLQRISAITHALYGELHMVYCASGGHIRSLIARSGE